MIEFLHRVVDTFTEYFNSCNETSIKEHVVIVFEVRKMSDEFKVLNLGYIFYNKKQQQHKGNYFKSIKMWPLRNVCFPWFRLMRYW